MAKGAKQRQPLTPDEREGIVLAVNSAFRKLKNLYAKIVPIFEDFGFTPPADQLRVSVVATSNAFFKSCNRNVFVICLIRSAV